MFGMEAVRSAIHHNPFPKSDQGLTVPSLKPSNVVKPRLNLQAHSEGINRFHGQRNAD
jgi:hypothetical protein